MGNYRNFSLATYFVADGTAHTTREKLEADIAFFEKYLRLDKVYIEPFRGGLLASDAQIAMVKEIFAAHGVKTAGGLTTTIPDFPDAPRKSRIYEVFCYTDERMLAVLQSAVERIARHFDEFIIDDFFFTNCTCCTCRAAKSAYNAEHGIEDGSWEAFRLNLMARVSTERIIEAAKAINPGIHIIIKFPNWMESFQETGYNPREEKQLYDSIYTGTETRDPIHTDQHLPRYLSFSLMRHFEAMLPGKNGGGWFDPYDCLILEHYLEQAYLTAFSKPKELMMFCFQSLTDTMNIAALGYQLDKLDAVLNHVGEPVTIPCYIPDDAQGEDNVQDFLGMAGLPVATTPYFPKDAKAMLLTRASACDPDIVEQLEKYLLGGGKAMVTSGFLAATMDRGVQRLTSIRLRGRVATVDHYYVERARGDVSYPCGARPVNIPVVEFRNNATWSYVKGIKGEENYPILLRDTYGKGEMLTLTVPDAFSDIRWLPAEALTRIRKEMTDIYLDGPAEIGLFLYDNDHVILYPFACDDAKDERVTLRVAGDAAALHEPLRGVGISPLYKTAEETVFELRMKVGQYRLLKIER